MTYVSRPEQIEAKYTDATRPAKSLFAQARRLKAVLAAAVRKISGTSSESAEEYLAAQARREAHRHAVDRLFINRHII